MKQFPLYMGWQQRPYRVTKEGGTSLYSYLRGGDVPLSDRIRVRQVTFFGQFETIENLGNLAFWDNWQVEKKGEQFETRIFSTPDG